MTRPLQLHLSLDEIDALLADSAGASTREHVGACAFCAAEVEADREVAASLANLAQLAPSEHFADRVMAQLQPVPLRIHAPSRAGGYAPVRRRVALAASLVLGAAASIIWSLANRETLAAAGTWLGSEAVSWLWVGVQGVASNLIEQPWYGRARDLLSAPARIAALSAAASLLYLGGVLALRRLMALPAPGAAHAHA